VLLTSTAHNSMADCVEPIKMKINKKKCQTVPKFNRKIVKRHLSNSTRR
jgi:hypothetical protein